MKTNREKEKELELQKNKLHCFTHNDNGFASMAAQGAYGHDVANAVKNFNKEKTLRKINEAQLRNMIKEIIMECLKKG